MTIFCEILLLVITFTKLITLIKADKRKNLNTKKNVYTIITDFFASCCSYVYILNVGGPK